MSSLRTVPGWLLTIVVVIIVIMHLASASPLRVEKLEAGDAVSKFQRVRSGWEESRGIFGTCRSTKPADFIPV